MSETFTCPRRAAEGHDRADSPIVYDGPDKDVWREDRTCSYDGSLHPDVFMDYIRDGGVIGPTDKSYKFYLEGYSGEVHGAKKFYTHHLTEEQGREFDALWRAGRLSWGYPGYPYVPLFIPGMSGS